MASIDFVTKHRHPISCLEFTADGNILTVGGSGSEIGLISRTGDSPPLKSFRNESSIDISDDRNSSASVCCSKKDDWKFYISVNRTLYYMDYRKIAKDTFIAQVDTSSDDIGNLVLNSDESLIAASDDAGHCRIFKANDLTSYRNISCHPNSICSSAAFLNNDDEIITAGYDCKISRWNYKRRPRQIFSLDTRRLSKKENTDDDDESSKYFINPPFIHSLTLSADKTTAAFGLESSSILLCHVKPKQFTVKNVLSDGHTLGVSNVTIVNENLISAGNDGRLLQWCNFMEEEKEEEENRRKITLLEGEKINWMTSGSWSGKPAVALALVNRTDQVTIVPLRDL